MSPKILRSNRYYFLAGLRVLEPTLHVAVRFLLIHIRPLMEKANLFD